MSNDTPTPGPILVPSDESTADAKKPNFFQRNVVAPIKSHPKIATAVAAGGALIVAAACLGRKTADLDVVVLDSSEYEVVPAEEVDDTTVA